MRPSLAREASLLASIGAVVIVAAGLEWNKQMTFVLLIAGAVALGIRVAGVAGDLLNARLSR